MAKKILTEDAFNPNGNTHVESEIINESKEEKDDKEESDKTIEDKQESVNEEKPKKKKTIKKIAENVEREKIEMDINLDDVNPATLNINNESNQPIPETDINKIDKIAKETMNQIIKKRGFNDEDYYM